MNQGELGPQTVAALTQSVDQAVGLLRNRRYAELEQHLRRLERQGQTLNALRQSLENGAPAPPRLEQDCEALGKRLFVFSEVANEIATVESGLLQMLAGPSDASYLRDGQVGSVAPSQFQQEA